MSIGNRANGSPHARPDYKRTVCATSPRTIGSATDKLPSKHPAAIPGWGSPSAEERLGQLPQHALISSARRHGFSTKHRDSASAVPGTLHLVTRRSNGSFCFPNFDLKSTSTLLSQLDSKREVCRDHGMAPSHIPVEGGHHG